MAERGTVFVTGGSGYIGGWCVIRLLQQGYRVRTSVRNLAREGEVREAIGRETAPGDRLSFHALDLGSDEGWDEAFAGCDYVLHVASPLSVGEPKDPDEVIRPAREGARRAVGAAIRAGVTRIVLTSSVAAISRGSAAPDNVADETVWTDPADPGLSTYARSKTLAERAAWDLAAELGARERLAVVNPSLVIGPVLSQDFSDSIKVVSRILAGTVPGLPRLGFNIVDVRDLADLHILAMTDPKAGGERFIGAGTFAWMADMAAMMREQLGRDGAKITRRKVPDVVIRFAGLFDRELGSVASGLGRRHDHTAAKAERMLGWRSRPTEETVLDCARSLIAIGAV